MSSSNSCTWIPVALSNTLLPGEVRPVTSGELKVALWRDHQGDAHAMDTRCPHRGMNLAYGFVRDNHLGCPYHGWRYDASGQCVYIPSHPELPPARSIAATTYGCRETGGVVWIHQDEKPDDNIAPSYSSVKTTGVRTIHINASSTRVAHELHAPPDQNLIETTIDYLPLLLVLQPVSNEKTAIHVLILKENAAIDDRLTAADWSCRFRDDCEKSTEKGS